MFMAMFAAVVSMVGMVVVMAAMAVFCMA